MSLAALTETYATPEFVVVPIDDGNAVKMRQLASYGDARAHEAEREKVAARWADGRSFPPGFEHIGAAMKKKPKSAALEDARAAYDLHKLMVEPGCSIQEAFDLVLKAPKVVDLIFRVCAIQSTKRTAELFQEEFDASKKD